MSNSFQAQDSQIQSEQLKVQRLVLKYGNPLLVVDGADIIVDIREELAEVVQVLFKDDSLASIAPKAQANLSIETGISTNSRIRIASITLAASDVLSIEYKVV